MEESVPQTVLPYPSRPTSPPATPSSQSRPRFPSAASHSSPNLKRMGFALFAQAQSPPLEHIEATGRGHEFKYTRPQVQDVPAHHSSESGRGRASSPTSSDVGASDDDDDDADVVVRRRTPLKKIVPGNLIVEELADTASGFNSDVEVVRPDHSDEAGSERSWRSQNVIIDSFQDLNCEESEEEDEAMKRYRRRRKRWSAGHYKRSHSQSVGSDTDVDDTEALAAHNVGSSARRLRRRVRGPGDRASLIFEDVPDGQILEVDEPAEEVYSARPPSIPSDGENVPLEALPFWVLDDIMTIDSDSSLHSSKR